MAEFTANTVQTVAASGNVLFTETPISSGYVEHRQGSGVVTLKADKGRRARYKITYGGNIAIADGGAAGPISVALALSGEALPSATAIVTPAAVGDFGNVFVAVFVDVPCGGCCLPVSVRNISAQAIDVQNSNLIVERVA